MQMSFFNDTYCQLCDRLITKEDWNKHSYSSRYLHKEAHGYWPDYFSQRKLTGFEGSILQKAFWKMIFTTRDIKEVDEFLITNFTIFTSLNDYVTESGGLKKESRVIMEGQFEHNLYNKFCSNQLESDETDSLQQRIKWWMTVVDRGGHIPNDVYDNSFAALLNLYRKAIDLEMQQLVRSLRVRQIIPKKSSVKDSENN